MNTNFYPCCVFDNPKNLHREYYRAGKLVGFYTKEFLDQAANIIPKQTPMAAKHLRPFLANSLMGQSEALPENLKPEV